MNHTHESELQTPDRGTAWYAQWKKVSCDFQAFTFIQKGITLRQDETRFHIIFYHIKVDLERKPGFSRVSAAEMLSSSSTAPPYLRPRPA